MSPVTDSRLDRSGLTSNMVFMVACWQADSGP